MNAKRLRALPNRIRLYGLLAVYVLVVSFPFYYMVLTSLRAQKDVYNKDAMLMPVNLILDNYGIVLGSTNMTTWLTNSVVVGVVSSAIAVVIGTLAAYSLARLRFLGSATLARSVLFMYLVPSSLLFIPLFLIINNIGLRNTLWALILTYLTFNVPFCTWMLLGYFRTIPIELEDAARIDGCSRMGVLGRIILPLSAPVLAVVAVFTFLWTWNDFFAPLLYIDSQEQFTVALALATFVRSQGGVQWNEMMAANLFSILPVLIVYFLAQNKLIGGIASVGLKG